MLDLLYPELLLYLAPAYEKKKYTQSSCHIRKSNFTEKIAKILSSRNSSSLVKPSDRISKLEEDLGRKDENLKRRKDKRLMNEAKVCEYLSLVIEAANEELNSRRQSEYASSLIKG